MESRGKMGQSFCSSRGRASTKRIIGRGIRPSWRKFRHVGTSAPSPCLIKIEHHVENRGRRRKGGAKADKAERKKESEREDMRGKTHGLWKEEKSVTTKRFEGNACCRRGGRARGRWMSEVGRSRENLCFSSSQAHESQRSPVVALATLLPGLGCVLD